VFCGRCFWLLYGGRFRLFCPGSEGGGEWLCASRYGRAECPARGLLADPQQLSTEHFLEERKFVPLVSPPFLLQLSGVCVAAAVIRRSPRELHKPKCSCQFRAGPPPLRFPFLPGHFAPPLPRSNDSRPPARPLGSRGDARRRLR